MFGVKIVSVGGSPMPLERRPDFAISHLHLPFTLPTTRSMGRQLTPAKGRRHLLTAPCRERLREIVGAADRLALRSVTRASRELQEVPT
jgi:hypothetical protein